MLCVARCLPEHHVFHRSSDGGGAFRWYPCFAAIVPTSLFLLSSNNVHSVLHLTHYFVMHLYTNIHFSLHTKLS